MASKYCTCEKAKDSLPNSKRLFWFLFLASFAAFGNIKVLAQIPPETDPSRIQQQLQPPFTPPPQNQEITVPRREELTPPPGANQQKFRLNSLQIEGVTVYTERIQKLYAEFLRQDISLSDLYQIANRITQLYRQDGYVLSRAIVPEQTIRNSIAKIQVIEGFIERVDFQGAPKLQLNRLQGFGNKIVASRPLNIRSLERYLLLANDLAGIQARGVLSPGSNVGAAILTVNVAYNSTNSFIDVNNRGSAAVGSLRLRTRTLRDRKLPYS